MFNNFYDNIALLNAVLLFQIKSYYYACNIVFIKCVFFKLFHNLRFFTQVSKMYIAQAQRLEEQGRFKEAEKLFISVQEPDLAISMYKKQRQYDQVKRKV